MAWGELDSGGEDWSEKRSPEYSGKCSGLQSLFYALAGRTFQPQAWH